MITRAVGPIGENSAALSSCYKRCLQEAVAHDIRSVAFCCISTGVYGYPNENAARVALQTVRTWLDVPENAAKVRLRSQEWR